jgi:hypothetical protein
LFHSRHPEGKENVVLMEAKKEKFQVGKGLMSKG